MVNIIEKLPLIFNCFITKHRGQVFILDTFNFFSTFLIFLLSFLSLLILSLTRLLAWDTPDSPILKCVPISFSFSPVYLWERNIFTFIPKADSFPKTVSVSSNISCNVPHDLGQIPGRRFNQKMIMVVHKTECVNNGIISLCGRLKIFKKLLPVALTFEYIFSFITSGSHMIKGPRIIYPQGTSQLSYISAVNILPYRIAINHIICQEYRPDPVVFYLKNELY